MVCASKRSRLRCVMDLLEASLSILRSSSRLCIVEVKGGQIVRKREREESSFSGLCHLLGPSDP